MHQSEQAASAVHAAAVASLPDDKRPRPIVPALKHRYAGLTAKQAVEAIRLANRKGASP